MSRIAFAVPGDLDTATGGYAYDRRLIIGLRWLGWEVDTIRLPATYPEPSPADRATAMEQLGELPAGVPLLIDGLAFGVMDREAPALARRGPLLALVHHPLAQETGLAPERAEELHRTETEALIHAHRVLVTSPATAQMLEARYGVTGERIAVAVPGTEPASLAQGSEGPGVRLLSVGSFIPRKGHLDLIAALSRLKPLDWELDLVGETRLDPAHAREVQAAIEASGLEARVRWHGALDAAALDALYDRADLFVLASHYEGYGMVFAEAIARGLPIVGTSGGAIPVTVGAAGELVPPGDVDALGIVLALLIADPVRRALLAASARACATELPRWDDTARIVADAISAVTREDA